MKHLNQLLDQEEQAILDAFESGKLKSIPHVDKERKRMQHMAKAHGVKNKRVSLRLTEWDFIKIQEEALKNGLPYQTLLSSIIHRYLTGQLLAH